MKLGYTVTIELNDHGLIVKKKFDINYVEDLEEAIEWLRDELP